MQTETYSHTMRNPKGVTVAPSNLLSGAFSRQRNEIQHFFSNFGWFLGQNPITAIKIIGLASISEYHQ